MGIKRLFNVIRGLNNGIQDEFIRDDELSDMSNVDIEKGIIKKRAGLKATGDTITTANTTIVDNIFAQSGQLLTVACQDSGNWYQINRDVISIFSTTGENIGIVFNRKGVSYNYKHFGILNTMVNGFRPKIKSISTAGFIERLYYYDHDHSEFMGIGVFANDIESLLDQGGNYKGIAFIDNSINIDDTGTNDLTECRFLLSGTGVNTSVKLYNKFGKYLDEIGVGPEETVSVTTMVVNNTPAAISQTNGVTVESDVTTDATNIQIRGTDLSDNYTSWSTTLSGTTLVTVGATGIKVIKSIVFAGTRAGSVLVKKTSDSAVTNTILPGVENVVYDGYKKYVIIGKHTSQVMEAYGYTDGAFVGIAGQQTVTGMGKQRIVRGWGQEIIAYDKGANKIEFYTFSGSAWSGPLVGRNISTTLEDMDAPVFSNPDNTSNPALVTLTNSGIVIYKAYYNAGTITYTAYKTISTYAVAYGYTIHSLVSYYKNINNQSLIVYLLANRSVNILSFADATGGQVLVTTTLIHLITEGETVTITGTTNYNGTFTATNVTDTTFEITDTWVSDDGTGALARDVMTVIGFDVDTGKVFSQRDVCGKDTSIPDENLMLTKNDNESGFYRVSELFTPEIANIQTVAAASTPTFNSKLGIAFETTDGDQSPPTNIGTAIGDEILIYNIPTGLTGVAKRHICYYDATNDRWNIIYTIDDNTTTNIIINTLTLGDELPVKHFFNINAVAIGTRGNRLVVLGRLKDRFTWYYTDVNEEYIGANSSEVVQEIDASDFTAMVDTTNAAYMFTNNSIWRVSGYDTVSFAQERLAGNVGCIDDNKIQVIRDFVYFVAKDGVYTIQGSQMVKISQNIKEFVDLVQWDDLADDAQTGTYRSKFCIYGQIRATGFKSLLLFDTDTFAWTIYDFTVNYDFFIVSTDTDFYAQMFFLNSTGIYSFSKFALPIASPNLLAYMWTYTTVLNPSDTQDNGDIKITAMNYSSEAVTITNSSLVDQIMTNWMLVDLADNKYTFPTFTLSAGASVVVHSGSGGTGTDTTTDLYWGAANNWNNTGDTAFLIRPYEAQKEGDLVYSDQGVSFTSYIESKKFTFDNPTIDRTFQDLYMYMRDTDATVNVETEVANIKTSTAFTLAGTDNNVVQKFRPAHGHGRYLKLRAENSDDEDMEIYGFEIQSEDHSQVPQ